jgi:hypothetical protein
MSDSKPYEIRAQILHLAQDILSENAHLKLQNSGRRPDDVPSYTTEEVLAEAEKLYEFVSKR